MPPQGHIPASERARVRVRSQRACGPCRKRKIKCDGNDPCAACEGYGYDCVYTEKPAPRAASSTAAAASTMRSKAASNGAHPLDQPGMNVRTARIDQPFMGQESIIPEPNADSQLLLGIKTRFTSAYSSIAWPRRLGISLGMSNPPRLQAFGWNPGTRAEPHHVTPKCICDLVSLDEMVRFADIYFQEVNTFFGFLNSGMFMTRLHDVWVTRKRATDFEACACMVFALGSYFSGTSPPSPLESEVVEHGRLLLDLSFALPPAMVSFKHVVAWTLRAIYLRLTTRPHLSWMASCTAVHVAESIGLQREITEIQMPRSVTPLEIESRRRVFWITMAVHQYFASEYGRSRIVLDSIACQPMTPTDGDLTAETVTILQSVPENNYLGRTEELLDALSQATALPTTSPFLALLKADACFCIYRMVCSTNSRIPPEQVPPLLEVIRVALNAVAFLSGMTHPWWNSVGTPFHSVCVLISIGTPESFDMVSTALKTLKNVTTKYQSYLSEEAFRTAHALVQGARDKKNSELHSLDRGLGMVGGPLSPPISNVESSMVGLEWSKQNELDFQDFLDLSNYYSLDQSSWAP